MAQYLVSGSTLKGTIQKTAHTYTGDGNGKE